MSEEVLKIAFWTKAYYYNATDKFITDKFASNRIFNDDEVDSIELIPSFRTVECENQLIPPSLKSERRTMPDWQSEMLLDPVESNTYEHPQYNIKIGIYLKNQSTLDKVDAVLTWPDCWQIYYKWKIDTGVFRYFAMNPNYVEEYDLLRRTATIVRFEGYETVPRHIRIHT